jgi:AraC family transcriptional regulator of adaptative response/methylated-DNA-[protein]-cysteine methyltransferase
MGAEPVRVLLVDDEAMVRVGLRMVLSGEPDHEVVGEAADGAEVPPLLARTRPDVLLMDVRMPRIDGLQANGSFYADAPQTLGMTPSRFRNGGAGATIQFIIEKCPLGLALVAASDVGVCAIYLGDNPEPLREALEKQFPHARLVPGNRRFAETVARVVAFIETPAASFDLPLDIRGTAFQQRVWEALRQIPIGKTVSYRELATQIGAPKAVRAVARACAANAIAVAIPCHRVVRSTGALSGYRWGPHRKDALLKRESRREKEKAEMLKC